MSGGQHLQGSGNWNAMARRYARVYEPLSRPFGLSTLSLLGDLSVRRTLEIAAGTGAIAIEAACRGADVTAIDASEEMARYARARSRGPRGGSLDFEVMDGQSLVLDDNAFDAAYSVFGVFLFADFRAGLRESARVLRPGGCAAFTVWAHPREMEHFAVWMRAVRADHPTFSGFDRPEGWLAMETPAGLSRELVEANFRDVRVQPVLHAWRVPSARWLAEQAYNVPFFQKVVDDLGSGAGPRVSSRLVEMLEAQYGPGEISLNALAHIGVGIKP